MCLPSLPKQTAQSSTRDLSLLAHLIRGTSIISSSNPYKLTVQGEREAAPARVHRVPALCWALSLVAPSLRAAASQERLCAHPCPLGLLTASVRLPTQPGRPARRSALAAPRRRPREMLCSAFRAHRCRPFLPHTQADSQKRQASSLGRHSTRTTPTPAGALPRLPETAKKEPPRNRGGDT